MEQAKGISKYYSVFEIINGIPQKTTRTENIYFYTEAEAEIHISRWIEKEPEATFVTLPIYRHGTGKDSEIKNRIKEQYTPLD